jgi:protein-S-isoprenylcysteine O-methyltransferase Ste14
MPRLPVTQPVGHLAVATLGGLTFVASLVYFAVSYTGRFGAVLDPGSGPALRPVLVDAALFTAFALHHSIFARTGVKTMITRLLPQDLERSAYVWIASLIFIAVCAWWQPVPGVLWRVDGPWRDVVLATQIVAGAATLVAARQLGVLRLAGVHQVSASSSEDPPTLDDSGLYAIVRHPIYLAWILLVWATPTMSATRLTFAAISTGYLVLAVPFEERDLRRLFGDAYTRYSKRVRWRIIPGVY